MKVVMEPGDLFEDADGMIWVATHQHKRESELAQLVWFGPKSKGFTPTTTTDWLEKNDKPHPESDANQFVPINVLNQPFTLIAELGKE